MGPESDMPIVDLARRLEDAGVSALRFTAGPRRWGTAGGRGLELGAARAGRGRDPGDRHGDVRTRTTSSARWTRPGVQE